MDQYTTLCENDCVLSVKIFLTLCLVVLLVVGCTVIAFNKGDVDARDEDSHNAQGTNKASTFDVNFSPR